MILFLDDDQTRTKSFLEKAPQAKTFEKADKIIETIASTDEVEILFLDHDLGGEVYVDSSRPDTGMEVVRYIEKNSPKINQIIVHTMNPYAGLEMTERLHKIGYNVVRIPFSMLLFRIN